MERTAPSSTNVPETDSGWLSDSTLEQLREEASEGCFLCLFDESPDEDWE
jgi:hypothetical protein